MVPLTTIDHKQPPFSNYRLPSSNGSCDLPPGDHNPNNPTPETNEGTTNPDDPTGGTNLRESYQKQGAHILNKLAQRETRHGGGRGGDASHLGGALLRADQMIVACGSSPPPNGAGGGMAPLHPGDGGGMMNMMGGSNGGAGNGMNMSCMGSTSTSSNGIGDMFPMSSML